MAALLTRVDALAAALAPNAGQWAGSDSNGNGNGSDTAHSDGTSYGNSNGSGNGAYGNNNSNGNSSGSGSHSMSHNSMAGAALALLQSESARSFDALRASFGLAIGAAPAAVAAGIPVVWQYVCLCPSIWVRLSR
jgi:hypothetical protein